MNLLVAFSVPTPRDVSTCAPGFRGFLPEFPLDIASLMQFHAYDLWQRIAYVSKLYRSQSCNIAALCHFSFPVKTLQETRRNGFVNFRSKKIGRANMYIWEYDSSQERNFFHCEYIRSWVITTLEDFPNGQTTSKNNFTIGENCFSKILFLKGLNLNARNFLKIRSIRWLM